MELYHYGIKGQKWGRRRYQNEDGTLTPAGKERYLKDEIGNIRREGKKSIERYNEIDSDYESQLLQVVLDRDKKREKIYNDYDADVKKNKKVDNDTYVKRETKNVMSAEQKNKSTYYRT